MRDLIVDGIPLRDPLGEWFIDYTRSRMLNEVSREYDSDPPYGYHGNPQAAPQEAYFGTGRESWVLNVVGTDKADFNLNASALQGLMSRPDLTILAAPQRSPLVSAVRYGAAFNVSADLILTARMRQLGSTAVERIDEQTARLTFIMENLNPFWNTNAYYTSSAVTIGSTSQVITLDSTAADSSAPITDGQARIKGPLTVGGTVQLRDKGNAFRALRYTATVALGSSEYVVIDMATMRAKLQTSATWDMTTGTDVSNRVTTSGDGAFYLSANPGASFPASNWSFNVTAVSNGYSAGTTAVDFRIRRAYAA